MNHIDETLAPLCADTIRMHVTALASHQSADVLLHQRADLSYQSLPAYQIHVLESVDSTNAWLDTRADVHAVVCIAEQQTAGRGRFGRSWHATPRRNLTLSLGWNFTSATVAQQAGVLGFAHGFALSALSLAVAVGLCRALQRAGVGGVAVKWPNDLVVRVGDDDADVERKLGGILIESSQRDDKCRAIIGVGLNLHLTPPPHAMRDVSWVDLHQLGHRTLERNYLAACILAELLHVCAIYASDGFAPFRAPWLALHAWRGRRIVVTAEHDTTSMRQATAPRICGTVLDVDEHGGLRIATENGMHTVHGGSIRLCDEG